MLKEPGYIKNTVVLIFWYIQFSYLMTSEEAWVLVSSGTQVQPQITLGPDYPLDYLSVSYDYVETEGLIIELVFSMFLNYICNWNLSDVAILATKLYSTILYAREVIDSFEDEICTFGYVSQLNCS